MTAKEYLNRYRVINNRIDDKLQRIEDLRSRATRLSPTAMFDRNGNVSDRVGQNAARIADLENEVEAMKREAAGIRSELESTISKVDDIQLRDLLTMRYIHGYSWRKIAAKMGYSKDHVWGYLHRSALEKVNSFLS